VSSGSDLLHEKAISNCLHLGAAAAVTDTPSRLTYEQLGQRAAGIALRLHECGVGPSIAVGLMLPKTPMAVAAALGILVCGGAYVPIDASWPPSRQAAVLNDCGIVVLITSEQLWRRLTDAIPDASARVTSVLCFEDMTDSLVWPRAELTQVLSVLEQPAPQDPAYILYTSGSTGRPKGVTVSHRSARTFVDWAVTTFRLCANDRLANNASLGFDLSVLDVFGALSTGAQVHLVDRSELLRPRQAVKDLARLGITVWYSVPSALTFLLEQNAITETPWPSLRAVLFAGEPFPLPQLRALMQALPLVDFYNLFGPTETNVCTFHHLRELPGADATAVPIGQSVSHLELMLLGEDGACVSGEGEGEILVRGPGVMSGYWRRPDLDSICFYRHDNQPPLDPPWYRTGDRAWRDAHNVLWFRGRRDGLVKIRGNRVELGEVSAALASLPGAKEAAVTTVADGAGVLALCAVVVPESDSRIDLLLVKLHCAARLPAYMVPTILELRTALPRTETGKLDLRELSRS
jgi:amino acid adenylation domain-containing protein